MDPWDLLIQRDVFEGSPDSAKLVRTPEYKNPQNPSIVALLSGLDPDHIVTQSLLSKCLLYPRVCECSTAACSPWRSATIPVSSPVSPIENEQLRGSPEFLRKKDPEFSQPEMTNCRAREPVVFQETPDEDALDWLFRR